MSNNISTRRVKYLGALVNPGDLENELNEFILLIILVLVESWEPTIIVLSTL